jgi:hypothetical protein
MDVGMDRKKLVPIRQRDNGHKFRLKIEGWKIRLK